MDSNSDRKPYWSYFAACAVFIVLTAAILWSKAHPYGVHWDEAEYLNQVGVDAQRLWAGKLLSLAGRIVFKTWGRPPAYRLLVLPFLAVFGFHVLVARLVSLGCFALSAWFTYLAAQRAAGRTAGAFASLIFALSPEVVSASAFFGTDTTLYLAISAMLYYIFTIWQDAAGHPKAWIGLGTAIGLGFLAKTSFFAIAIPVLIFWLIAGHYKWFGIPSLALQKKAAGLALLIAAPWWMLNLKTSFEYTRYARGFVRNSLGAPSIETLGRWLNTVVQGLVGHGLAILIVLVVASFLARAIFGKERQLDRLQRAAIIVCFCAAMPIVIAQLSGTNHLLRHISPAMIPLGICVGILAEESGWTRSWIGAVASIILLGAQVGMLVYPVAFPSDHPVDLAFSNGAYPWQALARFDQWDWTPVRVIGQKCGLDAPRIAYLGNGRAFDQPQIQFSWISKGLPQPEVTWLWRYEDGPINWQKTMGTADQYDIVITAPGFVGEAKIKEDQDNQHNAEFADRLSRDPHFQRPFLLKMGRFEPVAVMVYAKNTLGCPADAGLSALR